MDSTFGEFMERRYAEAEEYACGVSESERGIAEDAWMTATLAEREACANLAEETAAGRDAEAIAEAIRARSNAEFRPPPKAVAPATPGSAAG